ncbi:uncharacterized protein [Macaca fascicularis]|uniref:uncharacterized protein n=1 Tax=Macaca fascicularis TaxID=9541 RepID=UPI003D158A0B
MCKTRPRLPQTLGDSLQSRLSHVFLLTENLRSFLNTRQCSNLNGLSSNSLTTPPRVSADPQAQRSSRNCPPEDTSPCLWTPVFISQHLQQTRGAHTLLKFHNVAEPLTEPSEALCARHQRILKDAAQEQPRGGGAQGKGTGGKLGRAGDLLPFLTHLTKAFPSRPLAQTTSHGGAVSLMSPRFLT